MKNFTTYLFFSLFIFFGINASCQISNTYTSHLLYSRFGLNTIRDLNLYSDILKTDNFAVTLGGGYRRSIGFGGACELFDVLNIRRDFKQEGFIFRAGISQLRLSPNYTKARYSLFLESHSFGVQNFVETTDYCATHYQYDFQTEAVLLRCFYDQQPKNRIIGFYTSMALGIGKKYITNKVIDTGINQRTGENEEFLRVVGGIDFGIKIGIPRKR